jgi:hypothetical protein
MSTTITEERLFSTTGQLVARTQTPQITNLRTYRQALGTRIGGMSFHRYDGKRGVCFLLLDGRMLIVLLGREVEAMADTTTSTVETAIAAD